MSNIELTPHGDDHPSAFDLDSYSVAQGDSRDPRIAQHVDGCARCRRYVDGLESEREALLREMPPGTFVDSLRAKARGHTTSDVVWSAAGICSTIGGALGLGKGSRGWRPLLAVCAAMAVVVAVLVVQDFAPLRTSTKETWRMMGGFSVNALRRRGDVVETLGAPARVRAGDAVRFRVVVAQNGYVSVFFVGQSGAVNWLVPSNGTEEARPVQGGETLLEPAAMFDGKGTDTAFVVFSPSQFVPAQVAASLQAQPAEGRTGRSVVGYSVWSMPFVGEGSEP